ncbi:MAG: TetR family transcriptional regulator [Proteobacteria bacterium]|nr:TetR family transcriptional regulator [Pseudomonadota bacterium]
MTGQRDGEAVEARILAIALRHLRRDGLKRMAIVRIAADAGMTHANVYRYFMSKTALADRLVADWLRGIERVLTDIAQAPDPADDKLERFITLYARALGEEARGDPARFSVLLDADEKGRAVALRHRQRVRDLLARVLEEGSATRVFMQGDVRRGESFVFDALHRFLDPHAVAREIAADSKEGGGREARRDRITRLVLRGLSGAS